MLKQNVADYVAQHRAMGFKYRVQSGLLSNFATFAAERGDRFVKTDTVIDWCSDAPSPEQKRNRLLTVRRFSRWACAEDSRHQVPPGDAFGRAVRRRRSPYIYSPGDLQSLLATASRLTPVDSIRPLTFRTLIGLLSVSGLRISEALALDVQDIADDGLVIRATKFHKDRLVPIHESTRRALAQYLCSPSRPRRRPVTDAVFVSLLGTRLAYPTAISTFLELTRAAGLRDGPGHPGPCFHDLRHTFAVRSLEQCPTSAESVAEHITALSTYLGHVHVSDTYWYLEATPTLTRQIARAGETLHAGATS